MVSHKEISRHPDKEIIAQLTGYMRVGAGFMLASAACGVTELDAQEWNKAAEKAFRNKEDGVYRDLYEGIRSALAHAEVIALQRLSAEGGAAGAKWLLERMNPDKYGKSSQDGGKKSKKTGKGSGGMVFEEWKG